MSLDKPLAPTAAPVINRAVLMSGADYFDVVEINPYSHGHGHINRQQALADFAGIKQAIIDAGIHVTSVPAPPDCQDGIFTANWGLGRGDTVVLSSLPQQRAAEHKFAEQALRDAGKRLISPPYRFSGQGDALPCGNLLFAGSNYRTDSRMHQFLADELGYEVISLQTLPELNGNGQPVVNQLTGWPDSFFYDIDLSLAVLSSDLIAWFPGAYSPENQAKIRATKVKKIEVTAKDAANFACNLVSTGKIVVMGNAAPNLKADIEACGLTTFTVDVHELTKGGGFIRCTTLTLDNE